jgi:hypothetical protein
MVNQTQLHFLGELHDSVNNRPSSGYLQIYFKKGKMYRTPYFMSGILQVFQFLQKMVKSQWSISILISIITAFYLWHLKSLKITGQLGKCSK